MFSSRHRSSGSSANRWLIVAGAGLVILAFVARMLLDIGHTKVSDLAGGLRPDTTPARAVEPAVVAPEAAVNTLGAASPETARVTVATPPPILKNDRTSPPTTSTSTSGGYAVQIGAFGSEANAMKLGKRASVLGYTATVIPQRRGASMLYLVRVEGLSSAGQARQASDSLARTLGVKSVVVPPGR